MVEAAARGRQSDDWIVDSDNERAGHGNRRKSRGGLSCDISPFEFGDRADVEGSSVANCARIHAAVVRADLLLRTRFSRTGLEVDHAGLGDWSGAVAFGIVWSQRLPALFRLIQQNVWLTRRRDHSDAVALPDRTGSLNRR